MRIEGPVPAEIMIGEAILAEVMDEQPISFEMAVERTCPYSDDGRRTGAC